MTRPTYEQLEALLVQKDRRIAQLEARVARLEAQLQEVLRASKRQAAPFSKGEPKANPKVPGRKAGDNYGPKAHRPIPRQRPDEIFDVPLPARCPDGACGGHVVEDYLAQQYQTDIPRRPIQRRFDIHIGRCTRCGRRIQPRHPWQTSDALGAAASQLGPHLQAALVHLHKHAGLSLGKVADYVQTLLGITLTPSGVCQAVARMARRCAPTYRDIVASVPGAPWIVADETGWRIGGKSAWMHGFVTPWATVYHVAVGRDYQTAASIIGYRYTGKLIHDGWAPYDQFLWAEHQQCLAHLLRRCKELLETARAGAARFPHQVHDLLTDALALRDRRHVGQLSTRGLACATGRLRARLVRMLTWTRSNADNERLAKHLAKHHRQLFTFLTVPGLDATNWRAEQAMRPAAVNRKVWGGNRTPDGAENQGVLMTVLATLRQQHCDSIGCLADMLCGRQIRLALSPAGP
jgi:transposase